MKGGKRELKRVRMRILVPLLFIATLALLETPVMAEEAYQEVLANVVVAIFDHERFEKLVGN